MSERTQMQWRIWLNYLLAKADGNEHEAAEILYALTNRTLQQVIASLPPAERAKVLARSREIISEEDLFND